MNASFVHLHLHTPYSLLDSTLRLEPLFKKAAEDKMEAVAMTDHGNMFGAVDFFLQAKKFGIKPILGCEVYLAPGNRRQTGTHGTPDSEIAPYSSCRTGLHHLVLLCMNEAGYRNLCRLVSCGFFEGFYYKPRIDKEVLAEYHEGLIATSACLKGEIAHLCLTGDMDRARQMVQWYQKIFPDRFYLEIQQTGIPQQIVANQRIVALSKELGVPLIATADCHYLNREDAYSHEVVMAVQTGRTLEEAESSGIKSDQYFFKTQAEMLADFKPYPEALDNTRVVSDQCGFEFKFKDASGKKIYHFPKFEPPAGKSQREHLEEEACHGLEKRFREIESRRGAFESAQEAGYRSRLQRELEVIFETGFTGYFLIVSDFIKAAKSRGIPVGPGRGSGAGSLVAYCLEITNLDPIEHGLLFERFLNVERISLPDFDVDFCMDRRDEVIQYVSEKYGKENVAQIITFGTLHARGVIRDVARAFGIPPSEIDPVAKLVPEALKITIDEALEQEPRLRALTEKDPKMRRLIDVARTLEGLYRHASIHAAGLVISNRPMVEHCPLYRGKNDEVVIQYDMNSADQVGLIKFDFLGLTTLTFLRKAEMLIHKRHPADQFELDQVNLADKKMYEMLQKGDTLGVFQLESSGMQDLMKKLRPDCFADIVASNALYRPGPMGSGMLDDFIERKHGRTSVTYDFEELRSTLQETYGVIVYQEQVLQVAMILAGYTAGAADILRRAMGKKKEEEMAMQKKVFLEGAEKKGHPLPKAERIFDLMAKFAGYGFNKSHAAAYSMLTCQTAYIKAHYPVEFYSALLSIEAENTEKITKYIADAKRHNIEILPPDVNESETDFTILSDRAIRFGLGAIKGVGQIAIDSIIESRQKDDKFEDLHDFCIRTNSRTVNKRVIEALVKAGAFDGFRVNRSSLYAAVDEALNAGAAIQKRKDDNQSSFTDLLDDQEALFGKRQVTYPNEPPWNRLLELSYEKDTIGIYVTGHPLDDFEYELKRYTTGDIQTLADSQNSRDVMVGAQVVALRQILTKRGDRMAFATLEDKKGQIEAVVFSDTYLDHEALLNGTEPVWIKGRLEVSPGGNKIILSKKNGALVLPLRYAYEILAKEMHVHLSVPPDQGPISHDKLARLQSYVRTQGGRGEGQIFLHLAVGPHATTVLRMKEAVTLSREAVNFVQDVFKDEKVSIEFR